MIQKIKQLSIHKETTLRDALKQMDEVGHKLLIVIDKHKKFFSLLSIGDIQRAIIANIDLNNPVTVALRENIKVANENEDIEQVKNDMKIRRNEFMPVLYNNGTIKEILFWEDLYTVNERIRPLPSGIPVVIMAGGKGTRMKPLTNVLPKPLIPLNEKSIIEDIMDRFGAYNVQDFFISLNYKADFIQNYLETHTDVPFQLHFFREEKPLGTAGSLYLIKNKIKNTFFVSNCDILIDQDYTEVYQYHKKNNNLLTVFGAVKNYYIPYGTLKIGKNGALLNLDEKPEIEFLVNSGVYILEKEVLEWIPSETFFNITDLINLLINKNKKVGVFPVSDKSWVDMGNWDEYIKRTT